MIPLSTTLADKSRSDGNGSEAKYCPTKTDPDGAAVLQPGLVLPVRRALALPLAQEDEEAHHRHHQQRHGQ